MERRCANCGAVLRGAYCSECGQKDVDVRRPLADLLGDAFNSVFSVDSRALRTLGLIVASPGRLTRFYLRGQHARYLPPVRVFLFSSILFFSVLGLTGRMLLYLDIVREDASDPARGAETTSTGAETSTAFTPGFALRLKGLVPSQDVDKEALPSEIVQRVLDNPEVPTWLKRLLRQTDNAVRDPFLFNVEANVWIPRLLFLLVPVFAFILRLLYWGPRQYFVNHLYFALHLHTFLFLLLSAFLVLIPANASSAFFVLLLTIFGPYLLFAMKVAYQQSWLRTTAKWIVVSLAYFMVLLIALPAVLFVVLRSF